MKPAFTSRSLRPLARTAHRPELPPLTWPAPLDALPPLSIKKSPDSPGWLDTQPLGRELFEVEQPSTFEESLNGLQVRELIGSKLFERLFGPRPDPVDPA
ncbi:MAG: hypothetical protein U1F53_15405 [Burkholderiaceae bacterium]